ncbi:hypothetical protein GIB67_006054 [Kingdonia uniflora]|uniref:RRM domain-containing protein n=1 Tax=Kingdonia uniflora TaxID=39325 RepID=A0A7J7LPU7_9MAGN|nr:hypothetical protein GIB67_006054 [Kingdonia uniflora]
MHSLTMKNHEIVLTLTLDTKRNQYQIWMFQNLEEGFNETDHFNVSKPALTPSGPSKLASLFTSVKSNGYYPTNILGLSFRTTEEGLRNAFQIFGELVEVNLVMDRIANRPRGFAFLSYATEEESSKAIEGMHGKFLDGRVIFVEIAKPKSELRQGLKQSPRQYGGGSSRTTFRNWS